MRSTLYVSAAVAIVWASLSAQTPVPGEARPGTDDRVGRLEATDPERRALAACALRQRPRITSSTAITALVRLLADATPVPLVCPQFDGDVDFGTAPLRTSPGLEAGRTLGVMGEPAIEPLVQATRHANRDVRRHALRGLAAVRDVRGVGALVSAARDSDAVVRAEAAAGLRGREGADVTQALTALATDADASVRARAVQALGTTRGESSIPTLVGALADPQPAVRAQAATALGRRRDTGATDALLARLRDPDPVVREAAARALGRLQRER